MMRKTLFALVALLLLSAMAFAQTFEDFRLKWGGYFENRMNGWYGLAGLAIAICLLFNALAYMAGFALQSEELKRYAKSEFLQVSASSLLIFFAVSLLYMVSVDGGSPGASSAFGLMGYIVGGEGSSISCAAVPTGRFPIWSGPEPFGSGPLGAFKCKTQEKITALDRAYNNVVATNMPLERATSLCINLFGVPIYCGDWDIDLHKEVETSHLVATKIVSLLVPLHAQYSLAEYVQKNMLTVFLPFGLVLRIFPFTRGVGGLFIAIAIGFFFVFPTFFLLTDPTFVRVDEAAKNTIAGACFTGFRGATVLLAGVLSSTDTASISALANSQGAELVYQITIAAVFYPFIALAITLIFIRAMTPILGGDMGELMRMVARLG